MCYNEQAKILTHITKMKTIKRMAGLFSLVAAVFCGNAQALQLKDLHLPMTREEADSSLSKDYEYTILSDSSVRRTWKLDKRTVHVDFKLNAQGKALCIAVIYDKPAPRKVVDKDIKALTGGKCSYTKLGKPKKNTNTYGMEHALGAKVKDDSGKGDGWIFVEHSSASRKKCTRFVYYAAKPSRDRLSIGEAREDAGYTAMGSSGSNIDLSALREDEEDRRNTKPNTKPTGKRITLADTPDEPVASTTSSDDDFSAPDKDINLDDSEEPVAQTKAAVADAGKGFLPESISAPVQKILGLSAMVTDILIVVVPLLLLIIIWRVIVNKSRAKARKKAAESIMSKKPEQQQNNAE